MCEFKSYAQFLEELNKMCKNNAQFSRNLAFKTDFFGNVEFIDLDHICKNRGENEKDA